MAQGLTVYGDLASIKRTLDAYMLDSFPDIPIDLGPGTFNDEGLAEWFKFTLMGPVHVEDRFYRQVSLTERGHGLIYMPQVSIFVRPQMQQGNPYRLQMLRNDVRNKFVERTLIPIRDYNGDRTTLGNLVVRRTITDQETPVPAGTSEEDLQQWVVTVEADWTEVYIST